jgi:hypothetical protein
MAVSGMKGRVYYGPTSGCIAYTCDGITWPSVDVDCLEDEVTRFVIVDSVNKREFGHDKSGGWTDVLVGIRKLSITFDAMWVPKGAGEEQSFNILQAGRTLFLRLFPLGTGCNFYFEGYCVIDQITKTYDMTAGEPITYSCSATSRGPWHIYGPDGIVAESAWGGFECLTCGTP